MRDEHEQRRLDARLLYDEASALRVASLHELEPRQRRGLGRRRRRRHTRREASRGLGGVDYAHAKAGAVRVDLGHHGATDEVDLLLAHLAQGVEHRGVRGGAAGVEDVEHGLHRRTEVVEEQAGGHAQQRVVGGGGKGREAVGLVDYWDGGGDVRGGTGRIASRGGGRHDVRDHLVVHEECCGGGERKKEECGFLIIHTRE